MDTERFDSLVRSLTFTRSRRGALAALLSGSLGLLGLSDAATKNKKKGKGKKGKGKKDKTGDGGDDGGGNVGSGYVSTCSGCEHGHFGGCAGGIELAGTCQTVQNCCFPDITRCELGKCCRPAGGICTTHGHCCFPTNCDLSVGRCA